MARERKLWVHERLTQLGMERAEHWGWTNTYTYTKSLGEQLVLAADDVRVSVVRPAIVESAVRYPMPGWNEGFNTTAPLVYLMLKGHRQIVAGHRTPLDIIPVDMVAAGMLMAGGRGHDRTAPAGLSAGLERGQPGHRRAAHRADRPGDPPASPPAGR